MKVILATRNIGKASQIKALFKNSPVSIRTLTEAGIKGNAVEDGATLFDNALKKARFANERAPSGSWVMAEDSGIFINALNGAPGILSARWVGEKASTEDIMRYCLKCLSGKSDRTATFETFVVAFAPDGTGHFFSASVRGRLLTAPRVPPKPKMPYSSIFVPEGSNLTLAEMSMDQENEISHRGKAFRKVRVFLENTATVS
jgi:XTP/dITP diphosphohydrolase